MTSPRTETIEREKDKLFLTDAELIRRLGVPDRIGRNAIRFLEEKQGFPRKQQLWGDRRYWPAVRAYLDRINGLSSPHFMTPNPRAPALSSGHAAPPPPQQRQPRKARRSDEAPLAHRPTSETGVKSSARPRRLTPEAAKAIAAVTPTPRLPSVNEPGLRSSGRSYAEADLKDHIRWTKIKL